MTDEVKTTEEVQPQSESQTEEQAPVVEDQQPTEEATEQPEEASESQQQPPRPSRAEKRLAQLLERGKPKQDNSFIERMSQLPDVAPSEDGTITPEQLNQIVARETARNLQLAREVDTYHATVNDFTADVERVGEQLESDFKDNPKLAEKLNEMLSSMIEKANVRYDANGNQILVPSIKPSQLYSQLKETLSLAQGQGTQQATTAMAKQIAEGAVTPSTRQPETVDHSNMTTEEIWKNPGAVRAAMRAKLSVAQE